MFNNNNSNRHANPRIWTVYPHIWNICDKRSLSLVPAGLAQSSRILWLTLNFPFKVGFMILYIRPRIAEAEIWSSPATGRPALGSLILGTDVSVRSDTIGVSCSDSDSSSRPDPGPLKENLLEGLVAQRNVPPMMVSPKFCESSSAKTTSNFGHGLFSFFLTGI